MMPGQHHVETGTSKKVCRPPSGITSGFPTQLAGPAQSVDQKIDLIPDQGHLPYENGIKVAELCTKSVF
jgi:hypothetical protein